MAGNIKAYTKNPLAVDIAIKILKIIDFSVDKIAGEVDEKNELQKQHLPELEKAARICKDLSLLGMSNENSLSSKTDAEILKEYTQILDAFKASASNDNDDNDHNKEGE